jgi:hypothetical protein
VSIGDFEARGAGSSHGAVRVVTPMCQHYVRSPDFSGLAWGDVTGQRHGPTNAADDSTRGRGVLDP